MMKLKKVVLTVAVSFAALTSASAFARDVAVSVSVGQPGFYGTFNVGHPPVERVVYEPYVTYTPRVVRYEPVYHVPRYHRHDRYCGPRHYSRHGYHGHRHGGHRDWHGRDDRRDHHGGHRGRHD